MKEEIMINFHNVEIETPSKCPYCNNGMKPEILSYPSTCEEENKTGVVFSCPICHQVFFGLYSWLNGYPSLPSVYPYAEPQLSIPSDMKEIDPDFFEVYRQAANAEASNLDKICGMGYRKAVELLVKNYLIAKCPENKTAILSEQLSASIRRIEYPSIQALAKASTWIGNDETHIVKKNPEYGLPEMKKFILSLCHLILAEKASADALAMTVK